MIGAAPLNREEQVTILAAFPSVAAIERLPFASIDHEGPSARLKIEALAAETT